MEEKTPPYNIMSTARPRGEEEGRKFTLQATFYKLKENIFLNINLSTGGTVGC